jgi:hypothetical protein
MQCSITQVTAAATATCNSSSSSTRTLHSYTKHCTHTLWPSVLYTLPWQRGRTTGRRRDPDPAGSDDDVEVRGRDAEETVGSLRVDLDEVAQSKQEPQNAARGPDPAISDDDVEVRGRDGRIRRLSWCWSGKTGYRRASKVGATERGMGSGSSGIRRRRRGTGQREGEGISMRMV